MILKKNKEEVLKEIQDRASASISSDLRYLNMSIDMNSVAWGLQNAIAKAVTEGFRTLLENQYTDDDFEKDIDLNPSIIT